MLHPWPVHDAKARLSEMLDTSIAEVHVDHNSEMINQVLA